MSQLEKILREGKGEGEGGERGEREREREETGWKIKRES
jgi:hypothetical protein